MDHEELTRRFRHHPPSNDTVIQAHGRIRISCEALAVLFNELLVEGREKSLALTRLDEAAMYANASIARTQLVGP